MSHSCCPFMNIVGYIQNHSVMKKVGFKCLYKLWRAGFTVGVKWWEYPLLQDAIPSSPFTYELYSQSINMIRTYKLTREYT